MFFSSTGLTGLTVTPVVLQYNTFVPDFKLTCMGEKDTAVNTQSLTAGQTLQDFTHYDLTNTQEKNATQVRMCRCVNTYVPCVWPTLRCLSASSISYQMSYPFPDTGHSESVSVMRIIN